MNLCKSSETISRFMEERVAQGKAIALVATASGRKEHVPNPVRASSRMVLIFLSERWPIPARH